MLNGSRTERCINTNNTKTNDDNSLIIPLLRMTIRERPIARIRQMDLDSVVVAFVVVAYRRRTLSVVRSLPAVAFHTLASSSAVRTYLTWLTIDFLLETHIYTWLLLHWIADRLLRLWPHCCRQRLLLRYIHRRTSLTASAPLNGFTKIEYSIYNKKKVIHTRSCSSYCQSTNYRPTMIVHYRDRQHHRIDYRLAIVVVVVDLHSTNSALAHRRRTDRDHLKHINMKIS